MYQKVKNSKSKGTSNHTSVLSEAVVKKIYDYDGNQKELAKKLGITQQMVSGIRTGIYWSWLTGGG